MKMKTYDFDFVKEEFKKENEEYKKKSKEFISEDVVSENFLKDYPYQLKYHSVNRFFSVKGRDMETLLNDLGIETRGSNMYCPFHNDELGGKPSAKYHPESDTVYCFSESKLFTSYHVLKDLYGKDMGKVFKKVWNELSEEEKEELLGKYGEGVEVDSKENISPIWRGLSNVLNQFRENNVEFNKHKNALYKIMKLIYEDKSKK
jgi:predicted Zn-dependent protease with MMP-like domain